MSSGDVWHEANAWPTDPDGDMTPILEASIEQAKQRHPSGADKTPAEVLTKTDRCDAACGASAVYRMRQGKTNRVLLFCLHHWRKHTPTMGDDWKVDAANPELAALYGGGEDA